MLDDSFLLNSPIEFAITGPFKGRDRVLARSKDVGMDLIGLAAQTRDPEISYTAKQNQSLMLLLFFGSPPLNAIPSIPFDDVIPDADSRRSVFCFAWKGYASQASITKINKLLNLHLPEIYLAIKNKNINELEWALAPIIYQCTQANEKRLRYRRLILIAGAIYLGFGVVVGITSMFSAFLKQGFN